MPDKTNGLNPNVSQAANGTTVVDIRTPNQHGLSHNQYLDMQVDKSGIIFNNSGMVSKTQLAGYINANPYLAGTQAKVILNEVTGHLPTSINGYMEIAGNKANLILANPNGIVGNNFGFINVDRATLTTGKPQFAEGGSLNSFLVSGGDIAINGSGMDARTASQTDIIANAVKINAGLWANDLNIVTGKNEVNYNTQQVKTVADTDNGISLDVAAIGGMYAGRIRLVGTAQGVGVNNQGTINADNSDLILEQTGKIYNMGSMHAENNVTIQTGSDIEQTGTLYAGNDLSLKAANFSNDKKVKAGKTFTAQIENQIKNTDTIEAGDMDIAAGSFVNNSQIQTERDLNITVGGNIINIKDLLVNGTLKLQADNIENSLNGRIIAAKTQLTLNDMFANKGLLNSSNLVIRAKSVNNTDTGRIYGDRIAVEADILNNLPGSDNKPVIAARQQLDLGIRHLNNKEHAIITSAGDLAIGGSLDAEGKAAGRAVVINNNSATIEAGGDLTINAATINNINEHFATEVQEVGRENITEYQRGGQSARYKVGTPGVYEYTSESIHLHTPEGNFEDWTKYVYERIIKEDVIIETDPGKILAGGNMSITAGTLTNDKSQLIAGARMNAAVDNLQNIEAPRKRYYYDNGQVIFYSRHYQSGHDSTNIDPYPYNPAATVNNITVTAGKYTGNTVPEASGLQADKFEPGLNDVTKIPASSLYIVVQDSNSNYFVETDPAFADYKSWISSDYFFEKMQSDPEKVAKRLGDGYYEQQLVKNQVLQLTGKRYTGTYKSDEEQYQALLDNAVAFAQSSDAQIGVALTEQQIAELKTDIVWMVEQTVVLPNGEIVSALVPQVYIKQAADDEQFAGNAVLSAQDIDFKVTNDILNQGTIIAGDTSKITASNINNNNGTIAGSNVDLQALQDINSNGGMFTAKNNLQLTAGRDINIASTTSAQTNEQGHTTNISAIGSVKVTGSEGSLAMSAGRDVNLTAASVENSGSGTTDITAKNNINLGTVNISESHDLVLDADNQRHDNASMDVGTGISTKGSLNLQAGNDFNAKAAAVQSEDDLNVTAGGNINITAGRSTANAVDDRKDVGKSGGGNKQVTYTHSETHENNAIGNSFSGKNVNLTAGKNADVVSSNVTTDGAVKITAAENVNIAGSGETFSSLNTMDKKKSGMFGSERTKIYDAGSADSNVASIISGGSVDLSSGKDTNVIALPT
ncbi:MAG: filamentous hemagglutinin N-terminal domain-containing protein [Acidaminococcaceae bacterium]|nr:filamentous hemagglutinin N-terminal domain-containing protein [Acidaminococcaceae bacterium]